METLDHKTDPTKQERTIKAIDGKLTLKAKNEVITFVDSQVSSPKQVANYFNRQFTISKLARHTSSRETCLVSIQYSQLQRLLSMIVRSTLLDATCRWLSNYIRGRQSVTSCKCVKSKAMILPTGVPQGSNVSPTFFCF